MSVVPAGAPSLAGFPIFDRRGSISCTTPPIHELMNRKMEVIAAYVRELPAGRRQTKRDSP